MIFGVEVLNIFHFFLHPPAFKNKTFSRKFFQINYFILFLYIFISPEFLNKRSSLKFFYYFCIICLLLLNLVLGGGKSFSSKF